VSDDRKTNVRFAVSLVDIAARDFEASKVLFRNGFYPQALFMFQQSLEKTIKAILLKLGLVDVGELGAELGHTVISGGLELVTSRCILQTVVRIDAILRALDVLEKRVEDDLREVVVKVRSEVERAFIESLRGSVPFIGAFEAYRDKVSSLLEKLQSLMLRRLDDEERKRLEDLADEVSIHLLAAMIPEDALKAIYEAIYAIEKALTEHFTSPSPELLDKLRKLEIDYALASHLFELLYWYVPFERLASKLRYPSYAESGRGLWTPLAIDESTGIVEWYKDVSELIEKRKLFTCIREFIEENVETRECVEMVESIRDYINSVLEARQRGGQLPSTSSF